MKINRSYNHSIRRVIAALAALIVLASPAMAAAATNLTSASLGLSDSRPTQSATYTLTASSVTNTAIQCIKEVYATTSTGTTLPSGMSTSSATVSASSTLINSSTSGWTADTSVNGTVKYTDASPVTPGTLSGATFIVSGITNPAQGSYFLQFNTYSDSNCSAGVNTLTLSFATMAGQAVSLAVDPSLTFTVAGVANSQAVNGATTNVTTTSGTLPLGTVTASTNAVAAQDLTVTTNAGSGYTASTRYTAAPSNGSHSITDFTGSNASPAVFSAAGTEAFGYTTNSTTLGTGTAARFSGDKWAAFTTTNAEVAYSNAAVSSSTTRVGVQAGISGTTPAGSYTTTVIYTVTPIY